MTITDLQWLLIPALLACGIAIACVVSVAAVVMRDEARHAGLPDLLRLGRRRQPVYRGRHRK
jgi:hypothetical protein